MDLAISKGIENFYEKKFSDAMYQFSLALNKNPNSKEARILAILCDMATNNEEQAFALFEYYLSTKENDSSVSEDLIEELVNSVEKHNESLQKLINDASMETNIGNDNVIKYDDFISLIDSRGSFKEAFEDIMFSTKVLISKKEDFVDFLAKLIDNGFIEISLNYLESAISLFPNDEQLLSLINKVRNKELM